MECVPILANRRSVERCCSHSTDEFGLWRLHGDRLPQKLRSSSLGFLGLLANWQWDWRDTRNKLKLNGCLARISTLSYEPKRRRRKVRGLLKVGGINAPVLYAGPQGGFAGLDQVNIQLPAALAGMGNVGIQVTAGGITANPVQVTIQ